MSNLVPFKSMLRTFNSWPSIWDEDDFRMIPNVNSDLDVYETENEVVVKANVAGVNDEDIDVTFEKGVLLIKAKSEKEETEDQKYYSKSAWNYSYKIAVPGMIDYSKEPDLTVHKGILKIVFTKSEASRPKKLAIKRSK